MALGIAGRQQQSDIARAGSLHEAAVNCFSTGFANSLPCRWFFSTSGSKPASAYRADEALTVWRRNVLTADRSATVLSRARRPVRARSLPRGGTRIVVVEPQGLIIAEPLLSSICFVSERGSCGQNLRQRRAGRRLEVSAVLPHPPHDHREFAGNRDTGLLGPVRLQQLQTPASQAKTPLDCG